MITGHLKPIATTTEATSLDDISDTWKVVAKRRLRTVANEVLAVWDYTGTLSENKQNSAFRKMAFSYSRGEIPHISCVTGRDALGNLTLYARLYPMKLRRKRGFFDYV